MAETIIYALVGPAGTGKTYKIQQKLLKNPKWARLCATTGIAAINLGSAGIEGVITLQSTLGFFDTNSLKEIAQNRRLHRALSGLRAEGFKYLIIDEMSMLDAEAFDILVDALDSINANISADHGEYALGLMLVGDFLQLPPVDGEYCFEAKNWHRVRIQKLTEIKRQTDPIFQELLDLARKGSGNQVAKMLKDANCYIDSPSMATDITTIYAINAEVDKWNDAHYRRLCATGAKRGAITNSRWGKQRQEWTKNIPQILDLAIGAYVMVLSNDTANWSFVNGDCGTVVSLPVTNADGTTTGALTVQLRRTKQIVTINKITRRMYSKEAPQGFTVPECQSNEEFIRSQKQLGIEVDNWNEMYDKYLAAMTYREKLARLRPSDPYWDFTEKKWVTGEITYCPLRLAYASTVHKTQGLTLDNVQIVPNHKFFGSPNMLYVALSRCRTLDGLKIVGTTAQVAKYCNTIRKLERWF